jgi:methylthioribose-1-phosphate isomerase
VGADRVARNGDTANKIGTLGVALAARARDIPFYVVAPGTSFDVSLESGEQIPIEIRSEQEVLFCAEKSVAPAGVGAYNPAFDVTPAELITGYITEKGILAPPFEKLSGNSS